MTTAAKTLGLAWILAGATAVSALAAPPKKASPAKKTAATAAKTAKAAAKKPTLPPPPKPVAPPPMWSVAFSPDGAHIAVGTYRRVLVFDTATGAKTGDYTVSPDAVRAVAFSPDGKLLAAGTGVPDDSGSTVILDATTGKVVRTLSGHDDTIEAIAWADNADLLAASDDEKVTVADVTNGKVVGTLAEHTGRCLSVAVPAKTSSDAGGAIWLTGGADKMVKVWDAQAKRVVVNFDQAGCPVWSLAALGHPGAFIGGCDDGKLRFFTVRTVGGKSPDGVAERSGNGDRAVAAHEGAVYAVACAPDDSFLVSGGADKRVVEWNGNGYGKKREWTDAARDIWGVAVSPDSKLIAAASLDGRTRVYDAKSGALLLTLDTKGAVAAPLPAVAPAGTAGGVQNSVSGRGTE